MALLALYAAIGATSPPVSPVSKLALFIDSIDGSPTPPKVTETAVRIDGVVLDLVVDFLTCIAGAGDRCGAPT